jgi:8-oxo-dGTP pyrophosphatase MutT (NUDIX family)
LPSSNSSLTRRLFPLSADQSGAAESWIEHGERTPLKARPAASVVLLRDAPAGVETYLGYRTGRSPLGTVAFPGGSLEESDDDDVPWFGPPPAVWARSLGIEDHLEARRYVLAAIRELFEETGILLAGPDSSTMIEDRHRDEWMPVREAIAVQESTFAAMLKRRGLGVRTDLLKPLSHWITPDFAHRRFNTRYFAAVQPVNQQTSLLAGKGVWAQWCCAAQVIADRSTTALGDLIGQPDTVGRTLSELTVPAVEIMLEKIGSARGCIAYLSHKRPIRTFQPDLVVRDGKYYLEVEASTLTEGGSVQRGR